MKIIKEGCMYLEFIGYSFRNMIIVIMNFPRFLSKNMILTSKP